MTNDSFLEQMREATQILRNSGPAAATKAIQRALKGLGRQPEGEVRAGTPQRSPDVIDLDPAAYHRTDIGEGRTVSGSVTNAAGTRAYRLYVPSGYRGQPLPLVVMLHGCSQTPDDFATGTTMNAVAEENDCLVAYPGQTQSANGSNCWNWFLDTDQRRDRGEPSIIADITKEIARGYSIDVARTYVAGLSAGGAMAAIMATTYPDVFAAAGIHSGLAYGAAHDLPSALQAMKGSNPKARVPGASRHAHNGAEGSVPFIVFHGDRDSTVHPSNGEQAVAQAIARGAAPLRGSDHVQIEKGKVPKGHAFTRTIHRRADGTIAAEHWLVHGAGHAWSGGSPQGSYTDPRGPSAAREMLRFFLGQVRRGSSV
jgi:poly(hydroxyalkanoate) depolymerase family esterase